MNPKESASRDRKSRAASTGKSSSKMKRFHWAAQTMTDAVQAVSSGSMTQRQAKKRKVETRRQWWTKWLELNARGKCSRREKKQIGSAMAVEDFTSTLEIQDTMKIGCRVWSATKYTSIILVLLIREIFDNDDLEGDFTCAACFKWTYWRLLVRL